MSFVGAARRSALPDVLVVPDHEDRTGQVAWATTWELTEPRSVRVKPP